MKVIIIGGGGREHTLAWKLSQSPDVEEVVCAPGNAGTARVGRNAPVGAEDIANLLSLAKEEKPGLVVVGPEAPLALGLVDELEALGIPAFGPSAEAARIEASKAFSKAPDGRGGYPHRRLRRFRRRRRGEGFRIGARRRVGGQSGTASPPARVCCFAQTSPSAHAAISQIMEERAFGEAGDKCVGGGIFRGRGGEFSRVRRRGETALPMASAQDHKAIGEGDTGPNTGGMGAYSPAPVLSGALEERALETVIKPAIRVMANRGTPYKGILYAGLMVQGDELKVLEFNCRFGDPELPAVAHPNGGGSAAHPHGVRRRGGCTRRRYAIHKTPPSASSWRRAATRTLIERAIRFTGSRMPTPCPAFTSSTPGRP